MNSILKDALIFVVGFGAGFVTSKLVLKKKYEDKAIDEIDKMQQYFDKKLLEAGIDPVFEEEEILPQGVPGYYRAGEEEDVTENAPEESLVRTRGNKASGPKTDYTTYYKGDPAEEEHPKEDDDYYSDQTLGRDITEEARAARKDNTAAIKFIKAEDYGQVPVVSAVDLLYYTDGGVLTIISDTDEEVLDNFDEVESMIGDALVRFGFTTSNEEVIYIRNRRTMIDYSITKVHGSYEEFR